MATASLVSSIALCFVESLSPSRISDIGRKPRLFKEAFIDSPDTECKL
jgi:hypothetical protein